MLRRRRFAVLASFAVAVVLTAFVFAGPGAYFYAIFLESRWEPARPQTKAALESYLHLYSTAEISPAQSEWGNQYVLAEEERMVRYWLLWKEPLDVVYDSQDRVKTIFTSYE